MFCTAFHGVGTYAYSARSAVGLHSAVKAASQPLPGWELCASTSPVGLIGLVLSGECRKAFPRDVWSRADESGRRYTDAFAVGLSDDPADEASFAFGEYDLHAFVRERGHYTELFVEPAAPRAVWVSEGADEKIRARAEIIARMLNVPLNVVTVDSTVADVDLAPMQF
jgi:hypothetical protein